MMLVTAGIELIDGDKSGDFSTKHFGYHSN